MSFRKFETEREGQIAFFDTFRIDYQNNDVLIDNTDGIWKGNILEFKLNINNINKVLFQAIKYLSKMRVKGESIPATILLVSLNEQICYVFKSKDYFDDIHKLYFGAASKNNDLFISHSPTEKIDYSDQTGAFRLLSILKEEEYMPIDLDENCICGWAERYYRENPKAAKGDFIGDDTGQVRIIGEIREPRHFKGLINPYTAKTNEKFKYLMDKLNDRLKKKDLGAFYTPIQYCEKAKELVNEAIARIPKENDYIILDRCAGTGNLESVLTDEQLSHCVLSTYEYYEYKVLCERLMDKVRLIIPPIEMEDTYDRGYVKCADAMSKEYLENVLIKKYIDDEHCNIIMFENPPYRDDTSGMTKIKSSDFRQKSYVLEQMKANGVKKVNEIANRFIWSAFEYYLLKPNDAYILFSPIKYWKLDNLVNRKFYGGFLFNKKHFHAKSPSAITCISWGIEEETKEQLELKIYDIENDIIKYKGKKIVKKCYNEITKLFDKRKFDTDNVSYYYSNTNGSLVVNVQKPTIASDDIIAYFVGRGFGISNPNLNFNLLRNTYTDSHGFHIRKDVYKKYLPLLSIKYYLMFLRDWTEVELVCCSADKGFEYYEDYEFIKCCFIFANLNYYNKCLSTIDNNTIIKNELCFDSDTLASTELNSYKSDLNKEEVELLSIWSRLLDNAKKTKEYNSNLTYSPYQIEQEINTYYVDDNENKVYNYPEINGDIVLLKNKLKEYHVKYITPKLYKYELIK